MKSDLQLTRERIAAARGRLVRAWCACELAAKRDDITADVLRLHEQELGWAMAVASEHGLDPQTVLIAEGAL